MVQRLVAGWRVEPTRRGRAAHIAGPTPAPAPARLRPPSPRQAVWLLLRPFESLEPAQQTMRAKLLAAAPEVREALTLLEEFRRLVRERDGAAWAGWLRAAEISPIKRVARLCGQAAARPGSDRGGIGAPVEFRASGGAGDEDEAGEAADVWQGEVRPAPEARPTRQLSTESVPEPLYVPRPTSTLTRQIRNIASRTTILRTTPIIDCSMW